jgi:ABC-type multidrug transport system ATPase subunit
MAIIETERLTKRYGRVMAVDAASFTVERGQVFGFLGPNGSGKTTTIGMLLGILTPTAGRFRLFGRDGSEELHATRRRIGATLETPNFYPYLSGRDNLRIAANVKGVGKAAIDRALDLVSLADRQKDRFGKYSLGMQQRLALAATMLGDPELVILDEPTNGLDPEGMREVREIIQKFGEMGKTVFLSSHLLFEVERVCTHVAIIKKGRIVARGNVREILEQQPVVELRADGELDRLRAVIAAYPPASVVRVENGTVCVTLEDGDTAALNRYLAGQGVYVSHLAVRARTLEDAFLELTA